MDRLKGFLKTTVKWGAILGAIAIGMTWVSGMDFEARMGIYLFALAGGIAYVDGSHKDRMAALEYRVEALSRQLNGPRQY